MKRIVLLLAIVGLALVSCTDNSAEHEELLKSSQKQFIDKGSDTHPGADGDDDETDNEL